jgi:hypothetical protein
MSDSWWVPLDMERQRCNTGDMTTTAAQTATDENIRYGVATGDRTIAEAARHANVSETVAAESIERLITTGALVEMEHSLPSGTVRRFFATPPSGPSIMRGIRVYRDANGPTA